MSGHTRLLGWLLAFFGAATATAQQSASTGSTGAADWLLTGGKIFTSNDRGPWAESVAIREGKIIYVGDDAGASPFTSSTTRKTGLNGRLVIPGIVDGHTHPGYIGIEQFGTPWLPVTGKRDVLRAVGTYARTHPDEPWIRMCCWPLGLYGKAGPNRHDLDAIVPDRPVWLTSDLWHSVWVNSKALQVLGVGRNTPDPLPGVAYFVRDEHGEPTGLIHEGAGWQFGKEHFAVDTPAHEKAVSAFLSYVSEHGVTALYDGGNFGHEDRVYSYLSRLEKEGKLRLRYEGTYQIFVPEQKRHAIAEMKRLRKLYGGDKLRFNTIKLFMDGLSKNRTAAMLEPYADDPENRGNTMMTTAELKDFLIELHGQRLDLHVHVLGDRSVRMVLDAVEGARRAAGETFYPRVTLAHMGIVDPADYPRFKALGVIANFTPQWHGVVRNDPMLHALGKERYQRTLLVRPLVDAGTMVSFSSDDWILSDLSPFLGIQVGHTRRFPAKWIPAGQNKSAIRGPDSERLDLTTLLRGYTINGAFQLRMESEIGSIETGKSADLVVLDENLFEMAPARIHDIEPAAVVVRGELLHGSLR